MTNFDKREQIYAGMAVQEINHHNLKPGVPEFFFKIKSEEENQNYKKRKQIPLDNSILYGNLCEETEETNHHIGMVLPQSAFYMRNDEANPNYAEQENNLCENGLRIVSVDELISTNIFKEFDHSKFLNNDRRKNYRPFSTNVKQSNHTKSDTKIDPLLAKAFDSYGL